MANIHDVAKEAGVSISTVSRVIQGASNVLPETRARIEEAIQKLDYHPNRLAQQFRTQQTKNILVIVPEIGNPFFAEILNGIEHVANKNDYSVWLINSHAERAIENKSYGMLSQKMVDGIITFSIGIPKDELKQLAMQYPIVIGIRYIAENSIANVTIDNIKATKDITSYMLNLGHKKICYLAGPSNVPIYEDRVIGYKEALAERQIPVEPDLIVNCHSSAQGAYNAISSLLHDDQCRFSAIVASGESMAIGAIRALSDHGIRVPEDVAVSGFDDIEWATMFSPSLTTVRQPKYQIGVRTAEKLLDLISGKTQVATRDVLNYELVIRESSGGFVGNRV